MDDTRQREIYQAIGEAYAKAIGDARENGPVAEVFTKYGLELGVNLGIHLVLDLEIDLALGDEAKNAAVTVDGDWIKRMGIRIDEPGKKS